MDNDNFKKFYKRAFGELLLLSHRNSYLVIVCNRIPYS